MWDDGVFCNCNQDETEEAEEAHEQATKYDEKTAIGAPLYGTVTAANAVAKEKFAAMTTCCTRKKTECTIANTL